MLVDTHCHLEFDEYVDLDHMIEEIIKSDVKILVVSGYDVKSSIAAIALAHKYKNIYATVGFHPHDSGSITEQDYARFDEWLLDDRVVGIGEIGLDYHYDEQEKDAQIAMFKRQIDIARIYDKPIVVHNRDASADIYNILRSYKVKGIIHCFNDNLDMARKFIDLGFLLGIGGIITFKNNNIKNVVGSIPMEYIVLETDSPYLTPEPLRGNKNSPLNLPLIAATVSNITGIEYNDVVSMTTANATRTFDFTNDL